MAVKVTRCPHCQTSFRVREEQLSTARGMVRCGSCLQVFKAEDYFQEDNQSTTTTVAPAKAEKPAATHKEQPPAAKNTAPITEASSDDDFGLIHDDMDEDNDSEMIEDDPSVDFSLVNPEKGSYKKKGKKTELDIDTSAFDSPLSNSFFDNFSDDGNPNEEPADDESWAAALLEDEAAERKNFKQSAPTVSLLDAEREEDDFSGFIDDDEDDPIDLDELVFKPNLPSQPLLKQKNPVANVAGLQAEPLSLGTVNKMNIQWGWISGILIMLLIAASQVLYFNFDAWARSPQWRPFYTQLCVYAGCELPKIQNIGNMSTQHLVVQTHPKLKGALMVDTLLYNKADYLQPFPDLLLVFRDINERVIASRRFTPEQYISGEIAGQADMTPKSHTHIALEIVDPGPEAVSYHIDLLANH